MQQRVPSMVSTRNETIIKKELIKYLSDIGLKINTSTKARGNNGFFRQGRIDVSKNLDDYGAVKTIVHEYAHYVNFLMDEKFKNSFVLFDTEFEELEDELLSVTNFVDENSLCKKLLDEREKVKKSIKKLTSDIRAVYPQFSLTEEFKQFKRYAMWSNLGYLEKYDRVRLISWFTPKVYSIANVRKDFPNIPDVFVNYLKLRSYQRKRARITRRISKLNKYYSNPTELFARFVEGMFIDKEMVKTLAPKTYERFRELFFLGYYQGLKPVFEIVGVDDL